MFGAARNGHTVAGWPPARALMTGASGGIGAALAARLAARGTETWLAARRMPELEAQVARIRAAGGRAHALALDVSDADATYARLARLDAETGGIDLVVANAAVAGARAADAIAHADWNDVREIFQVNLLGAAATLMPFVAGMCARGKGQLVGISSMSADFPMPRVFAYGASKAGLTFMLTCLDMDLRRRGIPVTIVHPGFVRSLASATLGRRLPFLVETEAAIDIIERAMRERTRFVRFPAKLEALLRGLNVLPEAVRIPLQRFAERHADRSS